MCRLPHVPYLRPKPFRSPTPHTRSWRESRRAGGGPRSRSHSRKRIFRKRGASASHIRTRNRPRTYTMPVQQSLTPTVPRPSKKNLCEQYVGKPLSQLRTPAAIVDVAKVEQNCVRMLELAHHWGVPFRAHVKTHKTLEGSIRMLAPRPDLTASRAIAATMPEAWGLLEQSQAVDPRDVEAIRGVLDDVSDEWQRRRAWI